jgi:hypothetical protein
MSTKSSVSTSVEGSNLVIDLGTGEQFVLVVPELSENVRWMAMMSGLRSKIIDAAAIPRDTATGKSATDEEKAQAVRAMVERLRGGVWNVIGRGKEPSVSVFLQALAHVTGVSVEVAAAKVKLLDKGQVKALRANAKVAARMAELSPATGDDVLAGFVDGLAD